MIRGYAIDPYIEKIFTPQQLEDVKQSMGKDIVDYISGYLSELELVDYDLFLSFYLSSIGAHTLNLLNRACVVHGVNESFCPLIGNEELGCARRRKEMDLGSMSPHFFYRFGELPDLRVHTMHVAPSGYSKNFFMSLFFNRETGFLEKIGLPHTRLHNVTEAGYVGTIGASNSKQEKDAPSVPIYGEAKKYCAGIIAVSEFSSITSLRNTTHSGGIENDMMEVLEEGNIVRSMAKGELFYYSYHTLWGATQPGKRFDLTAGLGRRLNFLVSVPDKDMEQRYKEAQLKSTKPKVQEGELFVIRGYLYKVWTTKNVASVHFSPEYSEWKMKKEVKHTDLNLFDNVAMGYNFILGNIYNDPPVLEVKLDDRLRHLLEELYRSRLMLLNEGYVEEHMYDLFIPEEPTEFYKAVRFLNSRQYLGLSEAVQNLRRAIDEGKFGSFDVVNKYNTKMTIVYRKENYRDVGEAINDYKEKNKILFT
ncbi:MAG: hypothetical protein ACP5US_10265 [Candidatus Kryptoniota bacterium]